MTSNDAKLGFRLRLQNVLFEDVEYTIYVLTSPAASKKCTSGCATGLFYHPNVVVKDCAIAKPVTSGCNPMTSKSCWNAVHLQRQYSQPTKEYDLTRDYGGTVTSVTAETTKFRITSVQGNSKIGVWAGEYPFFEVVPACGANQFWQGLACTVCAPCGTGKYKSGGCSGTSDTACRNQPPCSTGEYLEGSSSTAKGACTTCSKASCPGGQYRSGTCSGTSNGYSCSMQPPCTDGQFLKGSSTTAKGSCTSCSNADCGSSSSRFRTKSCSGTNDGFQCADQPKCQSAQYLSGHSATDKGECKDQPSCGSGLFLKGASSTTKGTCTSCSNTTCGSSQYRTGSCGGTTDGFSCVDQGSCKAGEYLNGSSTTAKGTCTACDNAQCSSSQFRSGSCSDSNNGYRCRACSNTECAEGEFRTGKCSGGNDGYVCRMCANARCKDGWHRSGFCDAETPSYNCTALSSCPNGTRAVAPPNETAGVACEPTVPPATVARDMGATPPAATPFAGSAPASLPATSPAAAAGSAAQKALGSPSPATRDSAGQKAVGAPSSAAAAGADAGGTGRKKKVGAPVSSLPLGLGVISQPCDLSGRRFVRV